jgi:hypothetical protein
MAGIVKEPSQRLIAANEPIQYVIAVGEDIDKLTPTIEVEILVNDEKFGKSIYPTPSASLRTGTTILYTYVFNISERIQSYFRSENFFNKDGSETFENELWQCEFQIYVYDWKQNEDGVLERSASFAQSQRIISVNAVEQILSTQVVEDFTLYRSDGETPFFTYKPNNTLVGLNDWEYLSVWSYFVSHIKFESFDENNNLIQSAYLLINTQANEQKLLTFGVGPRNINDYNMSEGNIRITKNIAYYTVEGGIRCTSPDNWSPATQKRTYWVDTQDATSYRLHFIDDTGTQASVSIQVNKKESISVSSDTYERSRPLFGSAFDSSRQRIRAIGSDKYEFLLQNLTIAEVNWLKSILMTIGVYWQTSDDLFVPMIINDGNFEIIDSENPVNEIKFTAELSTMRYSQRN